MVRVSGRQVVVEGVETAARLNLLHSAGSVDHVQGFYISRPLQIDGFVKFLNTDYDARSAVRATKLSMAG